MTAGSIAFVGALTLASSIGLGLAATAAVHALLRVWPLPRAAGARCALWVGLLAMLLAAPVVFGVSALRPTQQIRSVTLNARPDAVPASARGAVLASFVSSVAALPAGRVPALAVRSRGLRVAGVLCLVWASGFGFSLGRLALGLLRLRRIVCASKLLKLRGVPGRGAVCVLVSDAFTAPVAVGYLRPSVVLPRSLVDASDADLENVLLHELEHLRRFDDVTALASAAILCVLWFNPLAHHAFANVAREREMACDEAVVSKTGKRAAYAATLWRLATAPPPQAGLLPSFGIGSAVVDRVLNLLGEHACQSKRARTAAIVAACAVFSAVLALAVSAPSYVIAPSKVTDFTSIALAGGRTLVIGGRTSRGDGVAFAQLYDARGVRTTLIPMRIGAWSTAAVVLHGGNVLVTGGMTPGGATAAAELYDARRGAFESVAPMRFARAAHTATLLTNGQVLIASGMGRRDELVPQTELYDPVRRRFSLTADGAARVFQTALLVDSGDVLMFGGSNEHGASHCAIIYGPQRHAYRNAGRLLSAGATSLTFRLSNRQVVTHRIRESVGASTDASQS